MIYDTLNNLPNYLGMSENLDAVMPGYTHLQRAQPTTFAHYMMAYANMLKRDLLEGLLTKLVRIREAIK